MPTTSTVFDIKLSGSSKIEEGECDGGIKFRFHVSIGSEKKKVYIKFTESFGECFRTEDLTRMGLIQIEEMLDNGQLQEKTEYVFVENSDWVEKVIGGQLSPSSEIISGSEFRYTPERRIKGFGQ